MKKVTQQQQTNTDSKLTVEQFVLKAIDALAAKDKKTGETRKTIHTVYSGFNDAFREYFPGTDPIQEVKKLVEEGKICFRFCRGGAIIGRPGVITMGNSSSETLKKMGL
ncbi:MAG: hypothetical protein KGJ35_02805 [Patescibacteria group bacterium]|nr:hypothetical protein [Patescibacteria group bacterium]